MIQASEVLKNFIKAQYSMEDLAGKLGVSRQTVYIILSGENVSSEMIEKIIKITGMDFEKAFKITKD